MRDRAQVVRADGDPDDRPGAKQLDREPLEVSIAIGLALEYWRPPAVLARLHPLVVPVGALHEPNLQRLRPLEAPSRCQDCLTLVGGVTQVCLEHDANGRTILKLLLAKQLEHQLEDSLARVKRLHI